MTGCERPRMTANALVFFLFTFFYFLPTPDTPTASVSTTTGTAEPLLRLLQETTLDRLSLLLFVFRYAKLRPVISRGLGKLG